MTEPHRSKAGSTAAALGNFDGLHLGHMRVLEKTLSVSKENKLEPIVILFDEHPKQVLCGERPPFLMTDSQRDELLEKMGFRIVKISFRENKDLTPEAFLQMLCREYGVEAVCCGFNYHCGKGASGDVPSLERLCRKLGIQLFAAEAEFFENEPISSTRIRNEIENGRIERANEMLGRFFSYKLTVVGGDRRGRTLGYPTINQFFPENFVSARFGVYASAVTVDGKMYAGVTNIGVRPTIGSLTARSETNIIGFSGELYGREIEIFLLSYLRPERKFESLAALSETIAHDAVTAAQIYHDKVRD